MSAIITYPEILCYYGEFGFFNMFILPRLEYIFTKVKPDSVIVLSTLKDYADILELKYPSNIIFIDTKEYSNYRIQFANIELDKCSYPNIIAFIKKMIPDFNEDIDTLMNQILEKNSQQCLIKDNTKTTNSTRQYISIFPRCRPSFMGLKTQDKNLDEKIWTIIVNYLTKKYKDIKIISHGHKNEKIMINNDNIINSKNILESVNYLNNSFLYISSDSGFTAFAKNCGVKNNIIISQTYVQEHVPYFSPFKNITRVINFADEKTIEHDLDKIINSLTN